MWIFFTYFTINTFLILIFCEEHLNVTAQPETSKAGCGCTNTKATIYKFTNGVFQSTKSLGSLRITYICVIILCRKTPSTSSMNIWTRSSEPTASLEPKGPIVRTYGQKGKSSTTFGSIAGLTLVPLKGKFPSTELYSTAADPPKKEKHTIRK